MIKLPLVSIIMPTYNRAYIITKAIASIQQQTYSNWELIIIDDGSTDKTAATIAKLGEPRIHYYAQINQGPSIARNHGLWHAKGEYVCYLDSDNELLPHYLAVMISAFQTNPQALYGIPQGNYSYELYIDGKHVDSVNKSTQFPDTLTIHDIFHRKIHFDMNGFMHKHAIIDETIAFDATLLGLEDWDFIMQIGTLYPEGFLYVPQPLYTYRQRFGADGLVGHKDITYLNQAKKFDQIYEKHKDSPLMKGQTWYPDRAERWRKLEVAYQAGKIPPAYLFPFVDHWPDKLKVNALLYT